jgi:ribosomal-protein-alanine N-acetyltransferase
MAEIELRTCRLQDLTQISRIEKASFPDDPYSMPVFIFYLMTEPEGFIVACEDSVVVGYVIATGREGRGLVESIAVLHEFRRRGIGEMLMRAGMKHLSKGFDRVFLQVDAKDPGTISFYQKLSFTPTGKVLKRYYPNGHDALEMVGSLKK